MPCLKCGSAKSEMPVSWKLVENCSGDVLRRSKNRVLVAGWRRVIGASVVPASILPSVGQKVRFGSFDWEVVRVEQVECDYDPSYLYRVDLVIRDESGKPVNFASGISNLCLDG
jgi:hypothetical protein